MSLEAIPFTSHVKTKGTRSYLINFVWLIRQQFRLVGSIKKVSGDKSASTLDFMLADTRDFSTAFVNWLICWKSAAIGRKSIETSGSQILINIIQKQFSNIA